MSVSRRTAALLGGADAVAAAGAEEQSVDTAVQIAALQRGCG